MGKKSKRAPRSGLADAAQHKQAAGVADATRQAEQLAPAHAYLQSGSRDRLQARAKKIATALQAKDSFNGLPELLHHIAATGMVNINVVEHVDAVQVHTLGMSLLGLPELMAVWPKHLAEAARGVIRDKVLAALQGEYELKAGRKVFAGRFEVGYTIVYEGAEPPEDSITARLHALAVGAGHARTDSPIGAVFLLAADVREGVLLPGSSSAEAVKHRKHGEEVFEGFVKLPVPSLSWQLVQMDFSIARLEDKNGDIAGPCRIVPPDVYMAEMAQYEIV